jgi:hypothetical protein
LILLNKAWSGREILIYPLPLRLTLIPYHERKIYKIHLHDGRTGEMLFSGMMPARHTGKYNSAFAGA